MESCYIKDYSYGRNRLDDLERKIAQLYCFSLPFRMITQLSFLKSVFGVCANYIPFIFHVLGMILWVVNEKGKIKIERKEALTGHAIKLTVWLNLSSIVMAFVIQTFYGNQGSENAFQGIAGMLVYFTQYLLMFLYNYRVFRLISIDELNKILHIDCLVLLAIGYMQVLVMNGIGAKIYDSINIFGVMNSSERLSKLSLSGAEGATAGCIIGVFVLPYLFSRIMYGNRRCYFELLLWTVPLYYTFSSTAYVLAASDAIVFAIFFVIRSNDPIRSILSLSVTILCIGLAVFILSRVGVLSSKVFDDIDYILFHKGTDLGNGSTVSRTVPLLVNWGAFKEFPVLGVGNGLQGYFYEKYFPEWAMRSVGSDVQLFLERSQGEISNGGVFIPSLLSGYGLVGCLLIIVFLWHCIKENQREKLRSQNFYILYYIAGIATFVVGLSGDIYGLYFVWFLLSIPFISGKEVYMDDKQR